MRLLRDVFTVLLCVLTLGFLALFLAAFDLNQRISSAEQVPQTTVATPTSTQEKEVKTYRLSLEVAAVRLDMSARQPVFTAAAPIEESQPPEPQELLVEAPSSLPNREFASATWVRVPGKINVPVIEVGKGRSCTNTGICTDNSIEVPNIRPADNLRRFGVNEGSAGHFNESGKPGSGVDGFYTAHVATINRVWGNPFWNLQNVKSGEKVYIRNAEGGEEFTYEVFLSVSVKTTDEEYLSLSYYNPKDFVRETWKRKKLKPVSLDGEELVVLFTCTGKFNYQKGEYEERLVVVARRV